MSEETERSCGNCNRRYRVGGGHTKCSFHKRCDALSHWKPETILHVEPQVQTKYEIKQERDELRRQLHEMRKEVHSWKYIYNGLRHAVQDSMRSEDEGWDDDRWASARHKLCEFGYINEDDRHIEGLVNGIIPPLLSPARIMMDNKQIEKLLEQSDGS